MVNFNDLKPKIIKYIKNNPKCSTRDLYKVFCYSERTFNKHLTEMVKERTLKVSYERGRYAVGNKTAFYEVV